MAQHEDSGIDIEIRLETGTYEGGWKYAATADAVGGTVEEQTANAIYTARVLWDEAYTRVGGCRRRITITTYGPNHPDGHVIRTETRP